MLFVSLMLISVLLCYGVCAYSLYNNKMQKSAYFNLLNVAILVTLLGNYVEAASQTAEGSMVGVEVAYLGQPFIPVLWLLCILEFCGVAIKRRATAIGLLLVPVLISCLAFTWEHNHLLFRAMHYRSENHFGQLRFEPGPLYPVKPLYMYLLIAFGVTVIIVKYAGGTRRFRQQAAYFLVSALIPVFTISNYLVETDHSWFDITPYGLALASVLFLVAHGRYGLSNYASALKNRVIGELNEGIILFDQQGIHLDSNAMAVGIFPQLADVRIGTGIAEMGYLPFDAETIRGHEGVVLEYVDDADGIPRTYNISLSRIRDAGATLGFCAVAHNITPLKRVMGDLEKRAYMDPLTGISNRGYFFEKANHFFTESFLAREPYSVVMFDLDHFKSVNDTHGHAAGDLVLREVAELARSLVRKTDILGRYGGEEFCIALPGTEVVEATAKAEELRRAIDEHVFACEGVVIPVTASFGVAAARHDVDGDTVESILKRADSRLYEAKRQGRNRVVSATPEAPREGQAAFAAKHGTKVVLVKNA